MTIGNSHEHFYEDILGNIVSKMGTREETKGRVLDEGKFGGSRYQLNRCDQGEVISREMKTGFSFCRQFTSISYK